MRPCATFVCAYAYSYSTNHCLHMNGTTVGWAYTSVQITPLEHICAKKGGHLLRILRYMYLTDVMFLFQLLSVCRLGGNHLLALLMKGCQINPREQAGARIPMHNPLQETCPHYAPVRTVREHQSKMTGTTTDISLLRVVTAIAAITVASVSTVINCRRSSPAIRLRSYLPSPSRQSAIESRQHHRTGQRPCPTALVH